MQERDVARIDAAFHRLQPVAFLQALGMKHCSGGTEREFPFRQRRLLARAAPYRSTAPPPRFDQRVGFQLDLLAEAALDRLGRHLDALAGDIVFPAMIGAAQAGLLVAAEPERNAAMRAELVDQAVAPLGVAEREQALGQELDPHRRAFVFRQFARRAAPASNSCGTVGPSAYQGRSG